MRFQRTPPPALPVCYHEIFLPDSRDVIYIFCSVLNMYREYIVYIFRAGKLDDIGSINMRFM